MTLNALYQDILMEHHEDPRNFGSLAHATCKAEGFNPMCGDRVVVELSVGENLPPCVSDIRFQGEGCSICMASASMMTEETKGKFLHSISPLVERVRKWMQGLEESAPVEGDLQALGGVRKFPVRIKCALLPWTTLLQASKEAQSLLEKKENESS